MNMDKFFSLKDFFYYYVAGIVWIVDLLILYVLISGSQDLSSVTAQIQTGNDALDAFLATVLTIVFPYLIGFSLNELGGCITKRWTKGDNDPVKWTVNYANNGKEGERIAKPAVHKICELANTFFAFQVDKCENRQEPDASLWFYHIRTYVEHKGGTASVLATRTRDLATFAESLLIPVPLFFGLVLAVTIHAVLIINIALSWCKIVATLMLAVIVLCILFWLLKRRYLRLREYWAKHVYRTFLIIATEELQTTSKDADKASKKEDPS